MGVMGPVPVVQVIFAMLMALISVQAPIPILLHWANQFLSILSKVNVLHVPRRGYARRAAMGRQYLLAVRTYVIFKTDVMVLMPAGTDNPASGILRRDRGSVDVLRPRHAGSMVAAMIIAE